MKKLTIGIPTYNRKDALLNLVAKVTENIRKQSLQNFVELLVIDNCSTAFDIFDLLNDYKGNNNFLKILRNEANIGAGANFLRVIESASGEYVWLLGDDELVDLTELPNLLLKLENQSSLLLLPHNKKYAANAVYFGKFANHKELFNLFYNLGSFFVLSIYCFNRKEVLKFMKWGYENVHSQHPYAAIALKMLAENYTLELINIPLLEVQTQVNSDDTRFDSSTAVVDILEMVMLNTSIENFWIFVKNDFYKLRKNFFTLNIGLTNKVDLEATIICYKRVIKLFPFCSIASFKSKLLIIAAFIRKNNNITSVFLYLFSRVRKNKFSIMTYSNINYYLYNNLVKKEQTSH